MLMALIRTGDIGVKLDTFQTICEAINICILKTRYIDRQNQNE